MPRVAVAVGVGAEPANVLHVSYISQTEKFAERGKWYKGELNIGRDEPSQASSQVRQEIIEELRPCLGSRGGTGINMLDT